MRKLFFICFTVILASSVSGLYGQRLMKNQPVSTVCYAGNKVNKIYIPPPKEYFEHLGQKAKTSIIVRYVNCPANVVTAVNYAISILETLLSDDVTISIRVTWQKISTAGVLAQSSSTGYYAGWGFNAFDPYAFYPVALAEKIAGRNLNRSIDGDFNLNINSSANWYFGIDGKTPPINYDLVTVALHEMIHGLGFNSSFDVNGTLGSYGLFIFDTFVENLTGVLLTDTIVYPNPSATLKTALTNGQVYFNGPLLRTYSSGSRARLYAPSTFDAGSSISHLDPSLTLPVNSLMSPFIDRAEAIHDPGKYTLSIMSDLGWINTSILHKPPKDTEAHLTQIDLSATIKSDTTYNHNNVGIVWSFNGFTTSDTLFMTSPGSNNTYNVTIPIPSYDTKLEYYLYVVDRFQRIFRSPSLIKKLKYNIYIGTDTVKPILTHIPGKFYFEKIDSIKLNVIATDNLALDTVYVEYKINDGNSGFIGLANKGGDNYVNSLIPKLLPLTGGDVLKYRIIALDKASVPNQKMLPEAGFFSVNIEPVNPVADGYLTDFSGAGPDFVFDGFSITRPSGFNAYGLNTPHPYVSPETTGDSIGYTAVLRTPVRFDSNGMITSFMEIVLVEPGEPGSIFGMSDFYDYVIVEGSKNYGKSWFRLTDGYDSRIQALWDSAYTNSVVGNNSTFTGNEAMLRKHTIFSNISDDIAAGDPMMVRFRLFSDPYANGWGWVVENLHIGALINSVEEISLLPLKIYPNPGNGLVNFSMADGGIIKPVRYSVFNSAGISLMNSITTGGDVQEIDISNYPSGLYFIVFYLNNGVRTFKYTLIR